MKLIFTSFFSLFLFAVVASAAPMSRVVAITGPQTIAVERDGAVMEVRLSGIEVTDARHALALLDFMLKGSWVLVENGMVYRSPDALLINRELVARGFARATAVETSIAVAARGVYLGEGAPGKSDSRATNDATSAKAKGQTPAAKPPRRMPRLTQRHTRKPPSK